MKNIKNIAIFLSARSGSKRLPNKHFLKINSKLNVIDVCILRLKKSKFANNIFLCTTKKKEDDKFKNVCRKHKIKLFRGSNSNVAKRIIDCAKKNHIETIVRVTADCPIIDPKLIDRCINLHCKKESNYTSNVIEPSFPDGQDVEVINLKTLIYSQKINKSNRNKEHVTYFIRKSKIFKKFNFKNSIDFSNRRWTLDKFNDFLFLKRVVNYFLPNIHFSWKDLIKAERNNKSLIYIKSR